MMYKGTPIIFFHLFLLVGGHPFHNIAVILKVKFLTETVETIGRNDIF